jgi:hypothetical protein
MSTTPRWLEKVYKKHGANISIKEASLLYRSDLTWDQHHALCNKGDLAALLAHLDQEDHPIERECFYVATINMTYRDYPQVAIEIGIRYIEEFYRTPEPFGPRHPPNGDILKRLVLLFDPFQYEGDEDYTGSKEHAIWVCKFALAFGVTDGTKKGFQGRLQVLEEQTVPDAHQSNQR